jgi:type VI secretion system protein ImpK
MHDCLYALFMPKNGSGPQDKHVLLDRMATVLDDFGRGACRTGASADEVNAAEYVICAAVDEIILHSDYSLRDKKGMNFLAGTGSEELSPENI